MRPAQRRFEEGLGRATQVFRFLSDPSRTCLMTSILSPTTLYAMSGLGLKAFCPALLHFRPFCADLLAAVRCSAWVGLEFAALKG